MDIARGIDKMHSRRLVHLDLKSPNILLSASGTAKIAVRMNRLPLAILCCSSRALLRGALNLWYCNPDCQVPCWLWRPCRV